MIQYIDTFAYGRKPRNSLTLNTKQYQKQALIILIDTGVDIMWCSMSTVQSHILYFAESCMGT